MSQTPTLTAYFGPNTAITAALNQYLARATRTIRVAMYQLTDQSLAQRLLSAHQRGVRVTLLLDHFHGLDATSQAAPLAHQGLTIYLDHRHKAFHHKWAVIDESVIICGSMNWTDNARTHHAEVVLIIKEAPQLAAQFIAEFDAHVAHSQQVQGPQGGA